MTRACSPILAGAGLVQLTTAWNSDKHHRDAAACAEHQNQDRCLSTKAIPCMTIVALAALSASSSQNRLQVGCDDLQDLQHHITSISQLTHQVT